MAQNINIIVEGNPERMEGMVSKLKELGYSGGLLCKDLHEAQTKIAPFLPCHGFMLMDVAKDVSEIVRTIHDFRKLAPEFTIIAILDWVSLEDLRVLIHCGIDQFLSRPFDKNLLSEKIKEAGVFRKKVLEEAKELKQDAPFTSSIEFIKDIGYKAILRGFLNELSELPRMEKTPRHARMHVDCDLLLGMNSIGIRTWIIWIQALQRNGFRNFVFSNVRFPILRIGASISSFFPPGSKILSFYLTYSCDALDKNLDFQFTISKDFLNGQFKVPQDRYIGNKKVPDHYQILEGDLNLVRNLGRTFF